MNRKENKGEFGGRKRKGGWYNYNLKKIKGILFFLKVSRRLHEDSLGFLPGVARASGTGLNK